MTTRGSSRTIRTTRRVMTRKTRRWRMFLRRSPSSMVLVSMDPNERAGRLWRRSRESAPPTKTRGERVVKKIRLVVDRRRGSARRGRASSARTRSRRPSFWRRQVCTAARACARTTDAKCATDRERRPNDRRRRRRSLRLRLRRRSRSTTTSSSRASWARPPRARLGSCARR